MSRRRAREGLREARRRQVPCLVEEQVGEAQLEQVRVGDLGLFSPGFKGPPAVHLVGHPLLEEEGHRVIVGEHVTLPGPIAQALELLEEEGCAP